MSIKVDYLLSIIIPVFKSEKFLPRCLDSILKQSDQNIEILVINDGSPGNCKSIVETYMHNHNNIVYLEKENGGLSSARNTGIANATGEFCSFVDSDDFVSENYISTIKKSIEGNKQIDLLIFGLNKVTKFNKVLESLCPEDIETSISETAINRLFLMREFRFHAVTKVIKTKLLKEDLLFPLDLYYEDVATTYKWLASSNTILFIPEILYTYVENENSITQEVFSKKQFDLWENAINIRNNINITDKQLCFYLYFIFRCYVDICRLLTSSTRHQRKFYIKLMQNDIKHLKPKKSVRLKNLIYTKDKYLFTFVISYFFPNVFFCFF